MKNVHHIYYFISKLFVKTCDDFSVFDIIFHSLKAKQEQPLHE